MPFSASHGLFSGALLCACAASSPESELELELCWGSSTADCAKVLDEPEPLDAAGAVCGEASLAAIPGLLRVGDRVPFVFGLRAPELDDVARLRLTASGSVQLVDGSSLTSSLDVDVAPDSDAATLRFVEVTSLGPGSVQLAGFNLSRGLTAHVAGSLALGVQPPRFRRLQGLAAQVELDVCSSLPSGEVSVAARPEALSNAIYTLSLASPDTCPPGYRGSTRLIWTGVDSAVDLSVTQLGQTLRCSLSMPGVIEGVSVTLVDEPAWTAFGGGFTATVQAKVTGVAADRSELPLVGARVVVTGPAQAEIQSPTNTDVDGIFSFSLSAPPGEPLPFTVFVEDRFRRLLILESPSALENGGSRP